MRLRAPAAYPSWAFLTAFVTLAAMTLLALRPPPARGLDAPTTEFSASRAQQHLALIASAPRPMGSRHHDEVASYVAGAFAAAGLAVARERAPITVVDQGSIVGGTTENVIATLRGEATGSPRPGAVLVVGHYDSISTGPGAGDNGAAVAAMIEAARALRAGAPLRRDVVFLATDGEEVALLGASAFARRHAGVDRIDAVLNFDGRGNAGPVLLFETRGADAALLRAVAGSGAFLYATSLSTDVYRRMPNDTDFTALADVPAPALNFAPIEGLMRYHTPLDDPAHLDPRTLQHQGDILTRVSRALAARPGRGRAERSAVTGSIYFPLPALGLVLYPATAALPLGLLACAGTLVFAVRARRSRALRPARAVLATAAVFAAAGLGGGAADLAWRAVLAAHPAYRALPENDVYGHDAYVIALAATASVAVALPLFAVTRMTSPDERITGGLAACSLGAVASAFLAPGGSYLFHAPALVSLALLALRERRTPPGTAPLSGAALLASAAPIALLHAPVVHLVGLALAFAHPFVLGLAAGFPLALVVLHLTFLERPAPRPLGVFAAATAAVSFALGSRSSTFDREHPYPSSRVYVETADLRRASWITGGRDALSPGGELDPRASRLLSGAAVPGGVLDVMPAARGEELRESATTPRGLLPPTVEAVRDITAVDDRAITLRVQGRREANLVAVHVASDLDLRALDLPDGSRGTDELRTEGGSPRDLVVVYWAVPREGLELTLHAAPAARIQVRVTDALLGPAPPDASCPPRPPETMPVPSGYGLADATLSTTIITL